MPPSAVQTVSASPYAVLFIVQVLYIAADVLTKRALVVHGFGPAMLASSVFWSGSALRLIAITGQLWLMSQQPLGKTMTLLFVAGIITSNVLGWLLFQEVLALREYVGVALAIVALLLFIL